MPTSKKDITIINLTTKFSKNVKAVPLGPLYLISALKKENFRAELRDYQLNRFEDPLNEDNVVGFLSDSAQIIGFSCMSDSLPLALLSAEKIKHIYPEKTILIGGAGVSEKGVNLLRNFLAIDAIIEGEGEVAILEFMRSFPDFHEAKSVTFRKEGNIVRNQKAARIANLDTISMLDYHALDFSNYHFKGNILRHNISSSRGCPLGCLFCGVTKTWGKEVYRRNNKSVIEEIRFLKETYGISSFSFVDDNFTMRRGRVADFCDYLETEDIKIEWDCWGDICSVDEKTIVAMSKAGCRGIGYGIESGSDKILHVVGKRFRVEQAYDIVSLSARYFEYVECSFFWGHPDEDLNDFLETLFFIKKIKNINRRKIKINLELLVPLYSSRLYNKYKDRLVFREGLYRDLKYTKTIDRMLSIIRKFPAIFPEFYEFPTIAIEKKRKFILNGRFTSKYNVGNFFSNGWPRKGSTGPRFQ